MQKWPQKNGKKSTWHPSNVMGGHMKPFFFFFKVMARGQTSQLWTSCPSITFGRSHSFQIFPSRLTDFLLL